MKNWEEVVTNVVKIEVILLTFSQTLTISTNSITKSTDYKYLMSKSRIYGGSIEIKSFSDLYNVFVQIVVDGVSHGFQRNYSIGKLKLQYSGPVNASHYNIIELDNNIFWENLKKKWIN